MKIKEGYCFHSCCLLNGEPLNFYLNIREYNMTQLDYDTNVICPLLDYVQGKLIEIMFYHNIMIVLIVFF